MIYQANNIASSNLPEQLVYSAPVQISQGNYLIRCSSPSTNSAIYIQPPVCRTKSGIWSAMDQVTKTQNTKITRKYTDLLFTRDDMVFASWMDKITVDCQNQIYEKRIKWFDASLDRSVIEKCFLPAVRMIKPTALEYTKSHYSIRVGVPGIGSTCSLRVFNESEQMVDPSTVLPSQTLQVVLELEGISCTTSSFSWEFVVKQVLVEVDKPDIFDQCIIVRPMTSIPAAIQITPPLNITVEELKEVDIEVDDANNVPTTYKNTVLDNEPNVEEIDLAGEVPEDSVPILNLVSRSDVYYRRYKEAIKTAKEAKELALNSFLEARRIKDTYLLDCDVSDTDSLESDTE